MDDATDAIFEEFLNKLSKAIDNTCIVSATNDDKYPDIVGVPLEVLDFDKKTSLISASKGNLNVEGPSRVEVSLEEVEIFYSEKIVKKVLAEHFYRFLDPAIIRMYARYDEEVYDPIDDDFY